MLCLWARKRRRRSRGSVSKGTLEEHIPQIESTTPADRSHGNLKKSHHVAMGGNFSTQSPKILLLPRALKTFANF